MSDDWEVNPRGTAAKLKAYESLDEDGAVYYMIDKNNNTDKPADDDRYATPEYVKYSGYDPRNSADDLMHMLRVKQMEIRP